MVLLKHYLDLLGFSYYDKEIPSATHHDIHEDDLDIILEKDISGKEEEGGGYKIKNEWSNTRD